MFGDESDDEEDIKPSTINAKKEDNNNFENILFKK